MADNVLLLANCAIIISATIVFLVTVYLSWHRKRAEVVIFIGPTVNIILTKVLLRFLEIQHFNIDILVNINFTYLLLTIFVFLFYNYNLDCCLKSFLRARGQDNAN